MVSQINIEVLLWSEKHSLMKKLLLDNVDVKTQTGMKLYRSFYPGFPLTTIKIQNLICEIISSTLQQQYSSHHCHPHYYCYIITINKIIIIKNINYSLNNYVIIIKYYHKY